MGNRKLLKVMVAVMLAVTEATAQDGAGPGACCSAGSSSTCPGGCVCHDPQLYAGAHMDSVRKASAHMTTTGATAKGSRNRAASRLVNLVTPPPESIYLNRLST
jgi:hypothetical protein